MNENAEIAVKYAGAMLGLLLIIFIIALLTPIMAKYITKLIEKIAFKDNTISFDKDDHIYKVRSIYDASYKKDDEKNSNGDDNNGKE